MRSPQRVMPAMPACDNGVNEMRGLSVNCDKMITYSFGCCHNRLQGGRTRLPTGKVGSTSTVDCRGFSYSEKTTISSRSVKDILPTSE